jgi:glucosamine--fructose-6-phosphate aminotransferase (isomerizing)
LKPLSGSVVREGLRRLVYRGYDGVGFALLDDMGRLVVRRVAGHIDRVGDRLGFELYNARVMVGHTRYASRGVPADFNSHPLLSCDGRVGVVSDGVIDGYEDLRGSLTRRGHRFTSTTDTEVLAHTMEELLKVKGVEEALLDIGRGIKGLYSAVFIVEGLEELLLVSRGQPLVIGLKGDGSCTFVSSDVPSLYGFADEAVVLEEGLVGLVGGGWFKVLDVESGVEVTGLQRKRVKYPVEVISKGGFKHYMLKEIYEVPEAMLRTTATLLDKYLRLAAMIISGARNIIIIGNGSSLHAGLIAQYYFADMAGLSVTVTSAAEFPYYAVNSVTTGTVVVAISQSGETSDVIKSVKMAKQRGAVIVGVTNVLGSRLTIHSNVYLPIGAGPEIAVPATKTFTSTLVALAILAGYTGLYTGRFSQQELSELYTGVKELSQALKGSIESMEAEASLVAERLSPWSSMYVASSGLNYPIALEGALKLKETAMVHAEGLQLGELRHGPIVLTGKSHPVIVVEPVEETALELYSKILDELRSRDAPVVRVSFREEGELKAPKAMEPLTPIACVVPLQLLAYKLGSLKGLPIDTPPGLAKAITT